MGDTRYTPPGTPLHAVDASAVHARTKGALLRIRIAFAGVILYDLYNVGRTLIDPQQRNVLVLMLASPVLMLALACGMNARSRICAVLLLVWALMPRVTIYLSSGKILWTPAWAALVCACLLGVWATFEYHGLNRRAEAAL